MLCTSANLKSITPWSLINLDTAASRDKLGSAQHQYRAVFMFFAHFDAVLLSCLSTQLFCPQVKTWTPTGELLSASGHHHSAIQALAIVPLPPTTASTGGSHGCGGAEHDSSSATPLSARSTRSGGSSDTTSCGRRSGSCVLRTASSGAARRRSSVSSVQGGCLPCKVWAAAADGSISVATDPAGAGVIDPASWRLLRPEGMLGAVGHVQRQN